MHSAMAHVPAWGCATPACQHNYSRKIGRANPELILAPLRPVSTQRDTRGTRSLPVHPRTVIHTRNPVCQTATPRNCPLL